MKRVLRLIVAVAFSGATLRGGSAVCTPTSPAQTAHAGHHHSDAPGAPAPMGNHCLACLTTVPVAGPLAIPVIAVVVAEIPAPIRPPTPATSEHAATRLLPFGNGPPAIRLA